MTWWGEIERQLREWADEDLRTGEAAVVPCLAAFKGGRPLFLSFLPGFPPHGHDDPIRELLGLAGGLRADRLALSMAGRAWSLDDPVVPVTEEVDLRQRVLVLEFADGTGLGPRQTSVVVPFDLPGPPGEVRWGERQVLHDGVGWIPDALQVAVGLSGRPGEDVSDEVIASRVRWLTMLGHDLHLAEDIADRIAQPFPPRPGRG